MSEFEQVLDQLGSFGPYQIRVFVLVSLFETPAACAMLLPIFVGAAPEWNCPEMDLASNVTELSDNGTAGSVTYNVTKNQCKADGRLCDGVVYSSQFTSVVSEWNLVCSQSHISDLITTIQMLGVLIGACVAGQLADLFGRKKILFIFYAGLLVVELSSAFTYAWQLYAVARFFIGGLVGGLMVVNFVLPIEFVTPKWRTLCGCLGFWAVGIMLMALLGYLVRDWRHLTIVCSTIGIPLLFTWWWIPESPRWLVQREQFKEAEDILVEMANFNKKPVPAFDGLETYAKREIEKRHHANKYSYWHLFESWQVAKTSLIAMFAWFTSSAVYYGINLNVKNLAGNIYLNVFLSGIVEIPVLILVLFVNNKIGRRWTVFMLMLTTGVSCLAILILDLAGKSPVHGTLVIIFALIGKAAIAGGWAAAQVLSAEVFPTLARNVGIGACSMAARVGGMVAPQLVFLSQLSKPLPFICFGTFCLLCAISILFVMETKELALPDSFRSQWKLRANDEVARTPVAGSSRSIPESVELLDPKDQSVISRSFQTQGGDGAAEDTPVAESSSNAQLLPVGLELEDGVGV